MIPPIPRNSTVAPIRSGATSCTLRAKKRGLSKAGWGMAAALERRTRRRRVNTGLQSCGQFATAMEHFRHTGLQRALRRDLAIPLSETILACRNAREGVIWRGLDGPGDMDAKTNLKARLPSRHVTEGPERAPHRSYYYAMGLTREQIHQPLVGV